MSTAVGLSELGQVMSDHRFAYLMTVGDDARPHAVAVTPALLSGELVVRDPGRRTTANALARPTVSLVWPPTDIDGYSLIVDGDAREGTDGLRIAPTRAVLHRPAPSPDDSGPCGSDCRELTPPG